MSFNQFAEINLNRVGGRFVALEYAVAVIMVLVMGL